MSSKIPIRVFIASLFPKILIPIINKGILKAKFISQSGVLNKLLKTIARPVNPPEAIVYGSKNILRPTAIIKHPRHNIIMSNIYEIELFLIVSLPYHKTLY